MILKSNIYEILEKHSIKWYTVQKYSHLDKNNVEYG